MYTLASKFGANVYIILQFTLATTYRPFKVLVWDLNQSSGFGHTLVCIEVNFTTDFFSQNQSDWLKNARQFKICSSKNNCCIFLLDFRDCNVSMLINLWYRVGIVYIVSCCLYIFWMLFLLLKCTNLFNMRNF